MFISAMQSTIFIFVILCVEVSLAYNERYYPNPQDNYHRCGRRSRSYICDPDGVLNYEDAARLDAELYRIVQDTKCPCSGYLCRNDRSGYKVGIAIVKNLKAEENSGDDKNRVEESAEERRVRMETLLDEAKQIALTLHNRWHLGQCHEDVLLLYSHEDNVIYTVTGSVARMKLDDRLVSDIAVEAKQQNYDNFAFRGLMRIVENYGYVFMDRFEPPPRPDSLTDGSTRTSMSGFCLWSLTAVTLITALLLTVLM